ncbi:DUF4124 domain-containing protein [Massilia sp. TWR1-2-2]|uniref:DUF4124 domain-containing protein n=1 Tax=Massilia sp. TWR1-2-2 TaxID=2804584 RepID=UPI003CF9DEF3
MTTTSRARLLAATALMAFATLAQAQYMWIDEKGIKQFSDRAPPPSIRLKNILKAPPGVLTAPPVLVPSDVAATPAVAAPAAAKAKAAPTTADRNADYNRRQKEKTDVELKEKEEREAKLAKAEQCEALRLSKRTFESGARIGVQQKNGERGYMTDQQRAVESAKIDKGVAGCQ